MITVENNRVVSLRYIMKNSEGEMLENTMNHNPVSYLHGSAEILPLLQTQLEGLKAGDKKIIYLASEPGLTSEEFSFEVILDEVRMALAEELILGYPVKSAIQKCEEDCACYDENANVKSLL